MEPQTQITLAGVVRSTDGRPVGGLALKAYQRQGDERVPVGAAVTDAEGRFSLVVERSPDAGRLFFRLFDDGGDPLAIVEQKGPQRQGDNVWRVEFTVTQAQKEPEADSSGDDGEFRVVRGRVLEPHGPAVRGAVVRAVHKTLRSESPLGEAKSNEAGAYEIRYTLPDGTDRVDLFIRAYDAETGDVRATSDLICDAAPHERVDLVTGDGEYRGFPEYHRLREALRPHLDGTPVTDLDVEDVEFLECTTDQPALHVAYAVRAARLEESTGIDADVFYGLFRTGLPTNTGHLLKQNPATVADALLAAEAANIISDAPLQNLDDLLDRFAEEAIRYALAPALEGSTASLGDLLDDAGLAPPEQQHLLAHYLDHEGPTEAFWASLSDRLGAEAVDRTQRTLQLALLTGNHSPLISAVGDELNGPLRDLARWDRDRWAALIDQTGVPPQVPGETPAERTANYIQSIEGALAKAFPTVVLAAHLDMSALPQGEGIATFFQNNPAFAFEDTRLNAYLAAHPDALDGVDEPEETLADLRVIERLFRITPDDEKAADIEALLAKGIGSAYAIRRRGEAAFVRQFAPTLGEAHARDIYSAASQTTGVTAHLVASYAPTIQQVMPRVIHGALRSPTNGMDRTREAVGTSASGSPVRAASATALPTLEELFGSLDLCACEHCASIFSPAAYLVDLLSWLDNRPAGSHGTALDVLFSRRSDIGDIDLTCENTNTLMPYVDLAHEILEQVVAPTGTAYQTTWDAETLHAQPEHLNPVAYDLLRSDTAVHPFLLPFDLWAEEVRTYLGQLGVARHELMALLSRDGSAPQSRDVAAEALGLTPLERQIIAGEITGRLRDFWGYPASTVLVDELEHVKTFLDRTGLAFEEFEELLAVSFINETDLYVDWGGSASCDLTQATLANLDAQTLARTHRFLRLRRKLDWRIHELGAALEVLPPHEIEDDFLIKLSHVQRIQETLGLALIPLLSLWGPIRTTASDGDALFDTLFLDKTITGDEQVTDPFRLNADRDELADTSGVLDDHIPTLLSALGITEAELDALRAVELTDDTLNLANLSALYRATLLAEGLDLSISEYAALRTLSDIDPFDADDVSATIAFADAAARVVESAISLAELDYLLRHEDEAGAFTPAESDIAAILTDIRSGLERVAAAYASTDEPAATQTVALLSALLAPEEVATSQAILEGTSPDDPATQDTFVRDAWDFADDAFISAFTFVAPTDTLRPDEVDARYADVLPLLRAHLEAVESETAVAQPLAAALDLDLDTTRRLLTDLLRFASDSTPVVLAFLDLLPDDSDGAVPEITEDTYPDLFDLYRRIDKVGTVLHALDLTAEDDVAWIFAHAADVGGLDISRWEDVLPLALPSKSDWQARFEQWIATTEMSTLRSALPGEEPSLFALLDLRDDGTTHAVFLNELAARTGWDREALDFLAGPDGFDLTFPDDYAGAQAIAQLDRCRQSMEMLDRLGISAAQAWSWNAPEVIYEQALAIKQAVRAKYDAEAWPGVAQPLRDALRDQQRPALVDFVVHTTPDVDDAAELFAHYLIDVEMTSCMMTSRIKQAISSAQLFVQRCLLNLEPDVQLTADDAEEWAWMKTYRVWEAALKIFLYPENFILPELRDDKSAFFGQLESELLQNDTTPEHVEQVYLNYLEKIDGVARLEIAGLYHDGDEDPGVVHVFGRTRGLPHLYYYRQWTDDSSEKGAWTLWERVDLDIEGDHLLPVVWNRRLYLFWPIFREGDGETTVQLAWSERKQERWTAKRVTDDELVYSTSSSNPVFSFKTSLLDGELWITCRDVSAHTFEEIGHFRMTGCGGEAEILTQDLVSNDVIKPVSTYASLTPAKFTEQQTLGYDVALEVPVGASMRSVSVAPGTETHVPMLGSTPGIFTITDLHQYDQFLTQSPFFYEDEARTFFVVPRSAPLPTTATEEASTDSPWDALVVEEQTQIDLGLLFGGAGAGTDYRLPDLDDVDLPDPLGLRSGRPPARRARGDGQAFNASSLSVDTASVSDAAPTSLAVQERPLDDILGPERPAQVLALAIWGAACRFDAFYHPYVCLLIKQLNRHGIFGLLDPAPATSGETAGLRRQLISEAYFEDIYQPTEHVDQPFPVDDLDFSLGGAYAGYNWEAFFHIPFLLAGRLSQNQRFEDAQRWFHYVFDPTDTDTYGDTNHPDNASLPQDDLDPARFWKIRPFYEADNGLSPDTLLQFLSDNDGTDEEALAQLDAWRADPFNPHLIARLRPVAYQKAVVMHYLDNLIAWADHLFARDTIESINEATQLYLLAAEILGERSTTVAAHEDAEKVIGGTPVRTFNDLKPHLDTFPNVLVELENELPATSGINGYSTASGPYPLGPSLFFCLPPNDKLLGYWDTVEDRLFKIRHCMNIEGVVRQLPLFQPPIDPMLLVRATAAGLDLSAVLSDLYAPLPLYRFQYMLQKALELCGEVRGLGSALLAALEKQDAEVLAALRSEHEAQLLKLVRELKEQQIDEAQAMLESMQEAETLVEKRRDYYEQLIEAGRISEEEEQIKQLKLATNMQLIAQGSEQLATLLYAFPQLTISGPESGGLHWGSAAQAAARALGLLTVHHSHQANKASLEGGWDRRAKDWAFQTLLAEQELEQIDKQIAAAEIRLAVAEQDLTNHDQQTANAEAVEEMLQTKFTNEELYGWMVGEISAVYFQAYELAYNLAKQAEKAYQHELGLSESSFIQPGYWDSLKKGLLSGERLAHDLRRMEVSFLEKNKRYYELTKHVSLSMLDPMALLTLKETGTCYITLPEALFDLDYPGHYMRRIKSVSLTIPAVTGPYTSVSATLTLLGSSVRFGSDPAGNEGQYARDVSGDDPRFRDDYGAIQSIATSDGQSDSGLFELAFRDERYLPFEGAGVISQWQLELPTTLKPFDYDTISDVILHVHYTARDGGSTLKTAANDALQAAVNAMPLGEGGDERAGLFQAFSARRDFPSEWHRFLHSADADGTQTLTLNLDPERFPYFVNEQDMTIEAAHLFLKPKSYDPADDYALAFSLAGADSTHAGTLDVGASLVDGLPYSEPLGTTDSPGTWALTVEADGSAAALRDAGGLLDAAAIEDLIVVCAYSISD